MQTPTDHPSPPSQSPPSQSPQERPSPRPSNTRRPGARHNQALGARGEEIAANYLAARGFDLIARNWRCKYGELDLLMRDGETIVAIEVKSRSGPGFGSALEAITMRKAARLRRLLLEWATETGNRGRALRVDAVGITMRAAGQPPHIDHLRAIS